MLDERDRIAAAEVSILAPLNFADEVGISRFPDRRSCNTVRYVEDPTPRFRPMAERHRPDFRRPAPWCRRRCDEAEIFKDHSGAGCYSGGSL
jgi:hypothetical protein